jgi:hypothetical protein
MVGSTAVVPLDDVDVVLDAVVVVLVLGLSQG